MPTFNPSPLVAAGDELVSRINAATWTPAGGSALTFTARRRSYTPKYEPTDTALYVDLLIMTDDDVEPADRGGSVTRSYVAAIVVQKVMADRTSVSELNGLVNFLQALADYFPMFTEITVGSGSQKIHCERSNVPIEYSPEELEKNGRYFGVAHLTFKGWYG